MSVLNVFYAFPSRVVGTARYLLRCPQRQETRERLEAIVSPEHLHSVKGEGAMIKTVISECIKMGLFCQSGDVVSISEFANERLGRGRFVDGAFRNLLTELLFSASNTENHDFGRLLAWFLAQDITTMRADQDGFQNLVTSQAGTNKLGPISDVIYDDFCYWSVYLGFARKQRLQSEESEHLMPDPTDFLERSLPKLIPEGKRAIVSLPEMTARIASLCPVFEGGSLYSSVERYLPSRPHSELYSAPSLGLLRLNERGVITLTNRSDAEAVVLVDGRDRTRYTHLTWNAARKGGS